MTEPRSRSERAAATTADPRWLAVVRRDPEADGRFVLAVRTTGIYCRPTCTARQPRPENVTFYASAGEAERAGFRACKRCAPNGPSPREQYAAIVAQACRVLAEAEAPPRLDELARRFALSPSHFHRLFRQQTGVTPREYAAGLRAGRAREALRRADSVTEAMYAAGYRSSGHFYAESDAVLGMTPGRYRTGAAGADIRFAVGQCSLGAVLVAMSERGVCAILLGDDPEQLVRDLEREFPDAALVGGDPGFERHVATVIGFVEAPATGLDLPLDVRGTAFQQRVWNALRAVPPGERVSYTELAQRVGAPSAARAVAGACAANTLAVAIPCHRVVRADGGLSGYRWGVERKRALLEREAAGIPT